MVALSVIPRNCDSLDYSRKLLSTVAIMLKGAAKLVILNTVSKPCTIWNHLSFVGVIHLGQKKA